MGTDLHQMTITNLRIGLNSAARFSAAREESEFWQALSQIVVFGFERTDGSPYKTFPDVFVYRRVIDQTRGSLAITIDGPPALIIEVLSESTYTVDLDMTRGKGYSYAHAGVQEYLVVDPTGAYLPDHIQAWTLQGEHYIPWIPDGTQRWHSTLIPIAFGMEGLVASVFTRDGRRMRHEAEADIELLQQEQEIARLRQLLSDR